MSLPESFDAVKREVQNSSSHVAFFRPRSIDVPASVRLETQGRLLKVTTKQSASVIASSGGVRGTIRGFSRASRKRLIEQFQRLQWNPRFTVLFVTLTYPAVFPDQKTAKRHLQAFRRRWARWYGAIGAVWRSESQERGATHFHLLIWIPRGDSFAGSYKGRYAEKLGPGPRREDFHSESRYLYAVVRRMWVECIKEFLSADDVKLARDDCGFSNVRILNSMRGIMSYISKYVAKHETHATRGGDPWGGPDVALGGDAETPVLDSNAYQAECGRQWGFWNPQNIPWAELHVIEGDFNRCLYAFRRVCSKAWGGLFKGQTLQGFSIFNDSAGSFFIWATKLLMEHNVTFNYSNNTDTSEGLN